MVSAENVRVEEEKNSNIVVFVIYHHVPLLLALKMKYLYTD